MRKGIVYLDKIASLGLNSGTYSSIHNNAQSGAGDTSRITITFRVNGTGTFTRLTTADGSQPTSSPFTWNSSATDLTGNKYSWEASMDGVVVTSSGSTSTSGTAQVNINGSSIGPTTGGVGSHSSSGTFDGGSTTDTAFSIWLEIVRTGPDGTGTELWGSADFTITISTTEDSGGVNSPAPSQTTPDPFVLQSTVKNIEPE